MPTLRFGTGALIVAASLAISRPAGADSPTIVRADNTVIRQSCMVRIDPGVVIPDHDGDGVIHVDAPNITIEFEPGSILRGAAADIAPDQYRGVGVRICGHAGVTVRGLHVSGYACGLLAERADRLVVERAELNDLRRDRLRSDPQAEDAADWLWPHENDAGQWLTRYGSGLCIRDGAEIIVRNCRARNGQNALLLERVRDGQVYDNDFSFLSGWGIALWRSNRNTITRNALDFCIRGYSHGVYNRGQDSAGILVFEQCSENLFAENSATHSGDGFFLFAGREALGEAAPPSPDFSHRRRGSNDNEVSGNDFSYAAAHGIEITFSFGNRVLGNRLVDNAICGIWGGYSQDTWIEDNELRGNGGGAYGLERGGVNIEHGARNQVRSNRFAVNACGVHLWWDDDAGLLKTPWAVANGVTSTENVITGNRFEHDTLALHLRGPGDVVLGANEFLAVTREIDAETTHAVRRTTTAPDTRPPAGRAPNIVLGTQRPCGARAALAGRHQIIMNEWGPWDHQSPILRRLARAGKTHTYELRGSSAAQSALAGPGVELDRAAATDGVETLVVRAAAVGVFPYTLSVRAESFERTVRDVIVATDWEATFFASPGDPRDDLEAWRRGAEQADAVRVQLADLDLRFAHGGAPALRDVPALVESKLPNNHFGLIARTRLPLEAGRWRITSLSDDGVRVLADGKPIIENWTWHGPTRDAGVLDLAVARNVDLVVEYFELDGYAILDVALAPE